MGLAAWGSRTPPNPAPLGEVGSALSPKTKHRHYCHLSVHHKTNCAASAWFLNQDRSFLWMSTWFTVSGETAPQQSLINWQHSRECSLASVADIENHVWIFIRFFNISSFTAHIQWFWTQITNSATFTEIFISQKLVFLPSLLAGGLPPIPPLCHWSHANHVHLKVQITIMDWQHRGEGEVEPTLAKPCSIFYYSHNELRTSIFVEHLAYTFAWWMVLLKWAPVWIFFFMIKCTLWHICTAIRPISYSAANIWICPVSHQSPRHFKGMQFLVHPVNRVSGPMLNPVPKSVHFMNYLNFGALFDFFLWSICWNWCNLPLVICLLISSWPNLYKSEIFWWPNHSTKGVEDWVTYPKGLVPIHYK